MTDTSGILGEIPVILMDKSTDLIEICSVQNLYYLKKDNYLIWSVKKFKNKLIPAWAEIKEVKKIKSSCRPFHLANSKNWILATEDTKFAMKTNCIISIQNIRKTTPLLSSGFPYSDLLDIQNVENHAAEPGEAIPYSTLIGNRYCDICEKMVACQRYSFLHYRHCLECSDYDLCEDCYQQGFQNPPHKREHRMKKEYGYTMGDYINAKEIEVAERGLLNYRDPIRYYSLPVKSFVDAQAKMLLADKTGYNAHIDIGNVLTYITLDTSYEAIEEEFQLTTSGQPFSNRKYEMIMRDRYISEYRSAPFLHLRNDRFNGRRHLLPHGDNVYVGNLLRHSYLIGEHYMFNADLEYVYQVKTDTGYYQAGLGGLIVCSK